MKRLPELSLFSWVLAGTVVINAVFVGRSASAATFGMGQTPAWLKKFHFPRTGKASAFPM